MSAGYEVVDQQWFSTRSEAEKVANYLAPFAARHGKVLGVVPADPGFLVTVEHESGPA